jgi:hypothetical protein
MNENNKDVAKRSRMRTLPLILGCVTWLLVVSGGYLVLLAYDQKSGTQSAAPMKWPNVTSLKCNQKDKTLVMFIHPKCPCTNASLTELTKLMTHCPEMRSYVVVLLPTGFPQDWEKTYSWQRAAAIPGVTVLSDPNGRETSIFRAKTSGETLVYSAQGDLLFSGGITGARGHEGDNQGSDAIVAIVARADNRCNKTKVFGCSLADDRNLEREISQVCRQ